MELLGEALRGLEDDERDALETELRLLANQALVAEGADPGDVDAQRDTLELVRDVLQLGLEQATGGDPEHAADVVREEHLKRIFQLGFSLTLQLKFRADRLMKRPLARIGEVVLLMPWEARVVEALRRRRPRRALKVEGAEPVIFRSRRELAECNQVLDRAEAQVELFTALLGEPSASQAAGLEDLSRSSRPLEAGTIWTALLAHALLEGVARPAPLLPERGGDAAGQGAGCPGTARSRRRHPRWWPSWESGCPRRPTPSSPAWSRPSSPAGRRSWARPSLPGSPWSRWSPRCSPWLPSSRKDRVTPEVGEGLRPPSPLGAALARRLLPR